MATAWKDPAGAVTPARAGNFGKLECADCTTVAPTVETVGSLAPLMGAPR